MHHTSKDRALEILDEINRQKEGDRNIGLYVAILHFALGYEDQGFESLAKAYEDNEAFVRLLKAIEILCPKNVRSDPRYIALLQKMGLA